MKESTVTQRRLQAVASKPESKGNTSTRSGGASKKDNNNAKLKEQNRSSLMAEYNKKQRQDFQHLNVTQHPALKLIYCILLLIALFLLYGMNSSAAIFSIVALLVHTKLAPKGADPTPGMVSALSLTAGAGCAALMSQTGSFDRFLGNTLGRLWACGICFYIYKQMTKAAAVVEEEKPLEIVVTVLEGRNLVPKDTSMMGYATTSDPYVVITHGKHALGKTDIVKQTLDPKWKGQVFRELVYFNTLETYRTVECNIFDYDVVGTDDPMGTVMVQLPVGMNSSKVTKWYPVEKGSGINYCDDATGDLLMEIEVIAPDDPPKPSPKKMINDQTPFKVTVHILEGRDLIPKDANILGKMVSSDPFVVVYLGDIRMGKTKVVKKTLNPVWDNQVFSTAVPLETVVYQRMLKLHVFDHDLMSTNDPMGTAYARIPIEELSLKGTTNVTMWCPVERGQGQYFCPDAKGEIRVSVEVAAIR